MNKKDKERYGGPTSQFHNRRRAAMEISGSDAADNKSNKARERFKAPSYYQTYEEKRQ